MSAKEPKDRQAGILLVAYLAVIAACLVLVIATLGPIERSLKASGMLDMIREQTSEHQDTASGSLKTVVFAIPQGSSFTYQETFVRVKGTLPYHETVEALLAGPTIEALAVGGISCIPKGTRLIGLTVSQRVAYIDLSKDFLQETVWGSEGFDAAKNQLLRTMRSFDGIRDIVILVEGARLP